MILPLAGFAQPEYGTLCINEQIPVSVFAASSQNHEGQEAYSQTNASGPMPDLWRGTGRKVPMPQVNPERNPIVTGASSLRTDGPTPRHSFHGCDDLSRVGPECQPSDGLSLSVVNIDQTCNRTLTKIVEQSKKGVPNMFPDMKDQQWRSIAEQASKEMDSAKLSLLVEQLCAAMDERNKRPGDGGGVTH